MIRLRRFMCLVSTGPMLHRSFMPNSKGVRCQSTTLCTNTSQKGAGLRRNSCRLHSYEYGMMASVGEMRGRYVRGRHFQVPYVERR